MNWEAIGAISEMLGAVGVIASLIYLAAQIRQNSRSIESQSIHAQTQQTQQTMAVQANPDVVNAIKKAYITKEELTPEEWILFEAYFLSTVASVRGDFRHFQKGFIDREAWEHRKRSFAPYFIADVAKNHWRSHCVYYEDEFRAEISALVDTPLDHDYINNFFNPSNESAN